jgi:lipid A 3-O-deacylase
MIFKKVSFFFAVMFAATNLFAAEEVNINNHQINYFAGNFDFSDDKQSAILVGFQHQDENLIRDTFLGNVSPVTGGFITENSAAYIYTGIEWNIDMGGMMFTPSFAPGLYHEGDGKDLGHILEFKSEVQLSYAVSDKTSFGASYNHVSNASLGDKNPGANSYMFNFLKKF